MHIKPLKLQNGTSLVELMIGITISLIIIAGAMSVFAKMGVSGMESVETTRLNQQLRSTMDFMSKELQRAGYVITWDGDGDGNASNDSYGDTSRPGYFENPVGTADPNDTDNLLDLNIKGMNAMGNIVLANVDGSACGNTNCDCILYSYDLDKDGYQGVKGTSASTGQDTDNNELFGIRLNNGAVEMKISKSAHSCTGGRWNDISDSTVIITHLDFTLTYSATAGFGKDATAYTLLKNLTDSKYTSSMGTSCTPVVTSGVATTVCLERRNIDIKLGGTLANESAITLEIRNKVKVKNDHYITP